MKDVIYFSVNSIHRIHSATPTTRVPETIPVIWLAVMVVPVVMVMARVAVVV